MIVLQMHGEPGSGKSTLARAVGRALPAVVLDKDIIGAALMEEGLPFAEVGKLSYAVIWRQLDDFLRQGLNVIIDSPCFWPIIEERGRRAAARFGAHYHMVECQCAAPEIERRLANRANLPTQPGVRGAGAGRPGMYSPSCERLILDASQPIELMAASVVAYLDHAGRGRAIRRPGTAATPGVPR